MEITPIGIQNLEWQFYVSSILNSICYIVSLAQIIWTVFNFSFVPIVYLFYPETAARTLEDIDRLFRENHYIFVFKHKEAISAKRPASYIEHEQQEMRRASSVADSAALREMSRVSALMGNPEVNSPSLESDRKEYDDKV